MFEQISDIHRQHRDRRLSDPEAAVNLREVPPAAAQIALEHVRIVAPFSDP
jgi:hypothetical protein